MTWTLTTAIEQNRLVRPLSSDFRVLIERLQADPQADVVGELAHSLRQASVEIHPQLEQIRRRREWGPPSDWDRLDAKQVSRLAQLPDGWAALGIASVHWNGFVREAAVRALAWRNQGEELPFLLVRLNDWVVNVRVAALAAVRARLTSGQADAWIRALPLVEALQMQRRAEHRALIDSIEALLRSPDAQPALWRGTVVDHAKTRRACFRLALQSNDCELLALALENSDCVVRVEAARRLRDLPTGERRRELLTRIIDDTSAAVRAQTLPLLDGEPEDWRRAQVDRLGCDSSASIRAAARKLLSIDWAARYRSLIGERARTGAVISGLGETGHDEDVQLLEPYLTDQRAKVRLAALLATAALDADSVELFVEALADSSKRLSRAAARVLEKRARLGLPDMLREVAERRDVSVHTRTHALDVIASQRFWPRLLWMLSASASSCTELAELAATRIDAVTGERPSTEQLAAVDRALAESPLPCEKVGRIRRELNFWR